MCLFLPNGLLQIGFREVNKMDYLILGRPFSYSKNTYRGVNRTTPQYIDDPDITRYWEWYTDEFGDAEYLQDKDKEQATKLIELYKMHDLKYELVRIANDIEENNYEEFLGIDIATKGGDSILDRGLPKKDYSKGKSNLLDGITELLYCHFRSKLNKYFLLHSKADANLFAKVVKEMQIIVPGYFEFGDFYPQYLYLTTE
jgi:hypothetical protein